MSELRLPSQRVQSKKIEGLRRAEETKALLLARAPPPPEPKMEIEEDFDDGEDQLRLAKYLTKGLDSKSPASAWAVNLFGPKIIQRMIADVKSIRYMFAPQNNTQQCLIAGIPSPQEQKNCWLCGLTMFNPDGNKNDVIECEHILPVIQAVLFLELGLSRPPGVTDDNALKLEYAWAHATCNHPKNNTVFIKEVIDPRTKAITGWECDDSDIEKALNAIYVKLKSHFPKELANKKAWLTGRLKSIRTRVQMIVDYLNRPGYAPLTILLAVAKLGDPERLTPKARKVLETHGSFSGGNRKTRKNRK